MSSQLPGLAPHELFATPVPGDLFHKHLNTYGIHIHKLKLKKTNSQLL